MAQHHRYALIIFLTQKYFQADCQIKWIAACNLVGSHICEIFFCCCIVFFVFSRIFTCFRFRFDLYFKHLTHFIVDIWMYTNDWITPKSIVLFMIINLGGKQDEEYWFIHPALFNSFFPIFFLKTNTNFYDQFLHWLQFH